MSMYYESLKPVSGDCTLEKWRAHTVKTRIALEEKVNECRNVRNESRRLRYEADVKKSWDCYMNNIKLHDRVYDVEVLIRYAENILPKLKKEKKLIEEEKFLTEILMQKCDTWISVCMEQLNSLDKKDETEMTRNDEGVTETKKEIELLEDSKVKMKENCVLAWEMTYRLEDVESKIQLNLDFKKEALNIDVTCQYINKMDTGVSFKVEPTKGPKKMLSLEEWSKAVYGLVEKGQKEAQESTKLRERMSLTRGVTLNEYAIQFDKTDYALRKIIYEFNREKNESQYQYLRVNELMKATKAEWRRLELFLQDVKDDLRCAETRCSNRFFRPFIEATVDLPFTGMNKEVMDLQAKVAEIEEQLNSLKACYNKLEADGHKLFLEAESKNKALQIQVQALNIRISVRYDPQKIYSYDPNVLTPKMVTQMPPPVSLYSNNY